MVGGSVGEVCEMGGGIAREGIGEFKDKAKAIGAIEERRSFLVLKFEKLAVGV